MACLLRFPAGADTKELSLEKALELALENNLNIRKSLIDLEGTGYSANRLWSEVFPTISATGGISYPGAGFQNPLFSGGNNGFDRDAIGYNIGAGISLGLNAGIPYSMRNIRLAYQSNLLRYEDALNQLNIQITKKYFSLIAEKNNLDYLEEILNLAQRHMERNQISFNNGLIRELILIQSRLGAENARFNYSTALSIYINNMGEFLAMLGLEHNAEISLSGEKTVIKIEAGAEALINEYLPRRPDIIGRRQEIERLENAERQTSLSSRAPSVRLSVDWLTNNFDPFTDRLSGSAQVSIPIDPWIPGTRTNQAVQNANRSVEKAKLDLQIAEDAAKTQIRSLTANLINSWDSVTIARLSIFVAERSYQMSEHGFLNGTVESLALEDARNNLASARQRLLQSELSYFIMTLDLCAALNINLHDLTEQFGVKVE